MRSYSFKIKTPERTWTISLRRFAGKPRVRACRDSRGRLLSFSDQIVGDRLIVLLSGGAQHGTLEIDFEGSRFLYFNYVPWWKRVSSWFRKVLGVSSGTVRQIDGKKD